jgi:hypothetical protein
LKGDNGQRLIAESYDHHDVGGDADEIAPLILVYQRSSVRGIRS